MSQDLWTLLWALCLSNKYLIEFSISVKDSFGKTFIFRRMISSLILDNDYILKLAL